LRYYFCIAEIELAQQNRVDLVVDTVEKEDDFTWSSDDEQEEPLCAESLKDAAEPNTVVPNEANSVVEMVMDAVADDIGGLEANAENPAVSQRENETEGASELENPVLEPKEPKEVDDAQHVQLEDQNSGSSYDIVEKPQISPTTLAMLDKEEEWGGWD
jgi:hypothetical protein